MISVIVACYNVEQYIEEAVRSVMHQTCRDLEIICVNDASTDSTLTILEKLRQEDSRIRIIALEKNSGPFAVRQYGIEAAQGDYITFLDGDDLLTPKTLEHALKRAMKEKVDVVQFMAKPFAAASGDTEHMKTIEQSMCPSAKSYSAKQGALVEACFVRREFSWNLCGKLFRAEVIKKGYQYASHERITMAEDLLCCFATLVFASGYAALMEVGYLYRQGTGVTRIQENFPLSKIRAFAEEYQVYKLLQQWLKKFGQEQNHKEALNAVRQIVFSDAQNAYTKVRATEREQALAIYAEYWPVDAMLEMLLSTQMGKQELAELVYAMRRLPTMQPAPHEVKVIGMFYYRMFNGGIERVMALLSTIFVQHGYHVVLFTDQPADELDYPMPASVMRVVLPVFPTDGDTAGMMKRMRAWRETLRQHQVDVMIYHAWINLNIYYDELFIKSMGIPLILHTHGPFAMHLRDGQSDYIQQVALQKKGYSLCDVIVALSEVDCAWSAVQGFRSVRTLNPPTFSISDIDVSTSTENNIIWVGRIAEVKQPMEALRIMRLVHQKVPDARLQMLGMADDADSLQAVTAYIQANHMEDYVSLEGQQPDVKPYYQAARAVLWTAKDEGAPMAMVESKTYGLPIVAYDIANVDMIREHQGMFVVSQYDAQGAADHLVELLTNQELHDRMSLESRRSAEEILAVDQMKQWEDIFTLAMTPKEPELVGSQLPPLDTAIQMMMEYLQQGEQCRQANLIGAVLQSAPVPDAMPAIAENRNLKWVVKKIIKYCMPNGIVQLRQMSLRVAGGSKRWLIKNIVKAILPYGVLRIRSILKRAWRNR